MLKERLASFLVPPLTAVILLYQVISDLQITLTHRVTLLVIGTTLGVAAALGVLAALGPSVVRVVVLAFSALLFVDVALPLSTSFESFRSDTRTGLRRDSQRVADLQEIKSALDRYIAQVGPLPTPAEYGEGVGPHDWWQGWWDVSSDGGFLDFLVEEGILPAVPRDPLNEPPPTDDPRGGKQYVYFVVPAGYEYAGGTCDPEPTRWHYMLAVTDLEGESTRPPRTHRGSGCACLWRDSPNFFDRHFDYVLCGTFDATDESRAQAAQARTQRAGARLAEREAKAAAARVERETAERRRFGAKDERRVADLLRIRDALQAHLATVGPLPGPDQYGEFEASRGPGFWYHQWDVSGEDGDGDGKPFLDFLVDSGVMPTVPVDPDNQPAGDGDPRGGRQYVYFLLPPGSDYAGGPCDNRPDRWYYLLGITDLQSEPSRPPGNVSGSGCECLWRNQPNYFQSHFDYVLCGAFDVAPAGRPVSASIGR